MKLIAQILNIDDVQVTLNVTGTIGEFKTLKKLLQEKEEFKTKVGLKFMDKIYDIVETLENNISRENFDIKENA